ncbi:hypothetical protein GVAV_002816 [Gurleya vavrai]
MNNNLLKTSNDLINHNKHNDQIKINTESICEKKDLLTKNTDLNNAKNFSNSLCKNMSFRYINQKVDDVKNHNNWKRFCIHKGKRVLKNINVDRSDMEYDDDINFDEFYNTERIFSSYLKKRLEKAIKTFNFTIDFNFKNFLISKSKIKLSERENILDDIDCNSKEILVNEKFFAYKFFRLADKLFFFNSDFDLEHYNLGIRYFLDLIDNKRNVRIFFPELMFFQDFLIKAAKDSAFFTTINYVQFLYLTYLFDKIMSFNWSEFTIKCTLSKCICQENQIKCNFMGEYSKITMRKQKKTKYFFFQFIRLELYKILILILEPLLEEKVYHQFLNLYINEIQNKTNEFERRNLNYLENNTNVFLDSCNFMFKILFFHLTPSSTKFFINNYYSEESKINSFIHELNGDYIGTYMIFAYKNFSNFLSFKDSGIPEKRFLFNSVTLLIIISNLFDRLKDITLSTQNDVNKWILDFCEFIKSKQFLYTFSDLNNFKETTSILYNFFSSASEIINLEFNYSGYC